MSERTLFELPAIEERPGPAPTGPREARVLRPMRHQLEWASVDLESLLPQDHPARVIWGFVEGLDLSAFYEPMRVRASAGAASFRGEQGLETCLEEARAQVERLAKEREHPDPGVTRRERAARERAARERQERVHEALAYLPQAQAKKERQRRTKATAQRSKVTKARVSTTDPQARVMKMPDGGFRPAYNVELATDSVNGVIVGVSVTSEGTDAGQAAPMEEQVAMRTGQHPDSYLMDGGFATREEITALEQRDVTVYAPVKPPRNKPEHERYEPRYGDGPEVAQWRQRMATDEAKAIYRQRGAVAEWTNAQVRLHGVSQFSVRGLAKVTSVMLLVAVAHNLLRWASMG